MVLSPDNAKYSGRKSTLIRSSTFSVTLIAKPPSWGQISPTMKPPKIGWIPIMPVKKAEVRAKSNVNATTDCVGPFCRLPVLFSIHMKAGQMAKIRRSAYPAATKRTQRAVNPVPAFTRATQRASRIQPTTSFPTPAERTMTPTGVAKSLSSVRIRHRTGNACRDQHFRINIARGPQLTVMAMATPIKSIYTPKLIGARPDSSLNWWYRPYAIPHPKGA